MRGLADKVALVAGAATGIGAATAARLAAEGARVVVADLDAERAEATAAEIRAEGGSALAIGFDIAAEDSVAALVKSAADAYGGIDLAHVNAGDMSALLHDTDALGIDLAVWDRTMAVNLRGHLLMTRQLVPELLRRGGGALVYTSSGAAFAGEPQRPAYAASKAGINALTRHVASRWGKEGLRANAVAPGVVRTERIDEKLPAQALERFLAAVRAPRLGEPEDIGALVAFLLSADAAWINGQVISVDGGTLLR